MTFNASRRIFVCALAASAACAVFAVSRAAAQKADGFSLSRYRNKNRLAFVFAPSISDKRFTRQKDLWDDDDGFDDRDLVRFFVVEKGKSTAGAANLSTGEAASLRRRFGVKSGDFRVLLVGKDGHTAYSSKRPVASRDLFGRIDKMPMRRDEMKRRG